MTRCLCGCGRRVTPGRQYAAGHNMRVPAGALRAGKRTWTKAEDVQLRRLYPDLPTEDVARQLGRTLRAVYARAKQAGLAKSAAYLASPAACRLGHGQGGATRFAKGHVPANKGLRRPGWGPGRMKESQFKKGERRGVANRVWKPIGTERITVDGYLERKVHDDAPEGVTQQEANRLRQRRWRLVHLIVWEEANGPVPRGYAVTFKNGDKRDIRLDNLTLITRRELMKRNSIHNLPKPLAQTIQLLGALNRQIRKRKEAHAAKQD